MSAHRATDLVPSQSSAANSATTVHLEESAGLPIASTPTSEKPIPAFTLDPADDPKNIATPRKWFIMGVISTGTLCATSCSSIAAFAQPFVGQEFHVSQIVTVLSISLFVLGLAFGPLLVGPLSEVYGRNPVYRVSYFLFWVFSWPVAFAPYISVYLIFRFITGFCSSAFLSVAGGSVGDLFDNQQLAAPMAMFTVTGIVGPVIGPLLSGFINDNLYWRWTWRIMIIWIFVQWLALLIFVPETFLPVIVKSKSEKSKQEGRGLLQKIKASCYKPFELVLFDRMAFLLDLWTSITLAIVYLTFQVYPLMFRGPIPPPGMHASSTNSRDSNPTPTIYGHGFSIQLTGLTFLGLGIGMTGAAFIPGPSWWARQAATTKQKDTPEARLLVGEVGGVLAPLGLFVIAFTTYPNVHWIAPIIGSVPFGMGVYYIFTSVFTYLVVAYRPIAASAMAANTAMRCSLSAVLPLFTSPMYNRMGTVGATAFLAALMTLLAPVPFIFRRVGARLREGSRFTLQD